MTEPVEIEIFGRTYQVRGERDAEYTRQLAEFVDEQMRSVAERSPPAAPPIQIAVLALLHVSSELLEAREAGETTKSAKAIQEKAEKLIEILDASLATTE